MGRDFDKNKTSSGQDHMEKDHRRFCCSYNIIDIARKHDQNLFGTIQNKWFWRKSLAHDCSINYIIQCLIPHQNLKIFVLCYYAKGWNLQSSKNNHLGFCLELHSSNWENEKIWKLQDVTWHDLVIVHSFSEKLFLQPKPIITMEWLKESKRK